jgi:CubicO group peptidase (beta-lactamase class C family)
MRAFESVHGTVARGFERVRDAFVTNFVRRGEVGAALCITMNGREVVHLWGGEARPGVRWTERTIVPTTFVAKGVGAFVIQHLADRGQLDVDAPVARYWPEFAAHAKDQVLLSHVLTHTAGLPWMPDYQAVVSLDRPESFLDMQAISARLADAPLVWKPGAQLGVHSITYGWILDEVVRRITGKGLGAYLRDEIAGPLGLDYWMGLPESEFDRVALLVPDPVWDSDQIAMFMSPETPMGKAFFVGVEKRLGRALGDTLNHPKGWAAGVFSASGIGDARSIARLYGLLSSGGELAGNRLVSSRSIKRHCTERFRGHDVLSGDPSRVALGYMLAAGAFVLGRHEGSFGHGGLGGALGFADPVLQLGFGYVMNKLIFTVGSDPRAQALITALYSCV